MQDLSWPFWLILFRLLLQTRDLKSSGGDIASCWLCLVALLISVFPSGYALARPRYHCRIFDLPSISTCTISSPGSQRVS